ncbi:alginate lyase [Flavobacteriaceae bacterium MAR_2010_105]|nr:alginate lyase [Flavobacteriaceae bacterium MAR_2010_105]
MFCALVLSCNTPSNSETKNEEHKSHPNLILTAKGVSAIKSKLGKIPLFDKSLAETKAEVDAEIEFGIEVPIPKDFSGGYTHERHKKNFLMLQKAGVLFQILDDEKYAIYVRDMLMAYAKLYPTLPIHPQERSYARGKLFWQCLNDSNWLVYTSQAYDCIYDWLSKEERTILENDLFRPFADFISSENPQFFNRVHNHSTWGNVAVGMIALVMDDDSLLQRALYGIKNVNLDANMKDNDGGFINREGKAGFFANLDEPFSPDGYYTEGPYYQRYAMYPFLIFAEALQNKKPELKIFEYKDSVLIKSVNALINLSDENGDFFPINDAQKGMSYYSRELVTAVDIAYHFGGHNPQLLGIAEKQERVVLDDSGLSVANDIELGKTEPFVKSSIELRDGSEGDQGGIGILRNNPMELVFKYAAQGLSHGHYDKLSFSLYEDGNEVLQDYGLARFVNIEQKGGGNYLKENTTWAKQTIAHNTVVQNEQSHFNGDYETGSKHHSEGYIFDLTHPDLQVVSAKENNAYPETAIQRTMAVIKDSSHVKPFVLDIVKVASNKVNQYDLPFYYLGQLMKTNIEYTSPKSLTQLGSANGYQHLFTEGQGISNGSNSTLNWLLNDKFYTLTSVTTKGDELIFARIGANDPNFNLRREPALILRKKNTKDALFVSIIESHGTYSPVSEFAVNAYSTITKIEVLYDEPNYTAVEIMTVNGNSKVFIISNTNNQKTQTHHLSINGKEYQWNGPFAFQNIK